MVNDQTDSQLLCAYAERRSEAAFAELVRRHVDLVYSAALRMVRPGKWVPADRACLRICGQQRLPRKA